MSKAINAPELPEPRGFSHAVKAGNTVYLAGQIGSGSSIPEQFENAVKNLLLALKAAGGKAEHLVSVQIFVKDVPTYGEHLDEIGHAWQRHFGKHYPAMGLFGATALFEPNAMLELMGVAVIPRSRSRKR
jgi:enamine deaminase RidA (YjgF/YER057c/UK114 family)